MNNNATALCQELLSGIVPEFKYKKIAIEIPAFNDADLINTINSAITQADKSDRLHFIICYQGDDMTDYNIIKHMSHPDIELIHVTLAETRGLCYARNVCQQYVRDDDDYILHIDSHMRFVKHWDTMLIEQIESYNDNKAVLSAYLPTLEHEWIDLPVDHQKWDAPYPLCYMEARRYGAKDYQLVFSGRRKTEYDDNPKRNVWISGHFLFSYRDYDRDVVADPYNYFYADELAIAVRTYTHGYNVYSPDMAYIYHTYDRPNRQSPSQQKYSKKNMLAKENEMNEKYRVQTLLNLLPPEEAVDLGEYGVGPVRTLRDFEDACGIYFSERKLTKKTLSCLYFEDVKFDGEMTQLQQYYCDDYHYLKERTLHVIVACTGKNSALECYEALSKYQSHNINVKYHMVLQKRCEKFNLFADKDDVDVIYIQDDYYFSEAWAAFDTSQVHDDDALLYIDSYVHAADMYYSNTWDEYMMKSVQYFGKKAVLSCAVPHQPTSTHCSFNTLPKVVGFKKRHLDLKPDYEINEYSGKDYHLLCDNLMCCKASIVKAIPIYDRLSADGQRDTYSVRLWTHGYDIVYPRVSYFFRKSAIARLENNLPKWEATGYLGAIFNATWPMSLVGEIRGVHEYGLGDVRRLSRWLELCDVNYSRAEMHPVHRGV